MHGAWIALLVATPVALLAAAAWRIRDLPAWQAALRRGPPAVARA